MPTLRPERALPIYTVEEPASGFDDHMVAAVTVPPAAPDQLEPDQLVASYPDSAGSAP